MELQIRRRSSLVVSLAAVVAAAAACGGTAPSSPDVWAVVDGREIHRTEVETAYRTTVDPSAVPPSNEEDLALRLDILEELITQNILFARAEAMGLTVTPQDVETALAEQRAAMTPDGFDLQLGRSGLTIDEIRAGIRRELTVQRLIEQEVASKVTVTDQEIATYYEQNRAQFNITEPQYRLARIVVTPDRDPSLRNRANSDAATAAEAQQKMQMLNERLSNGEDFRELAIDYSEDPQSVAQGGDLGFVPASSLAQISPQLLETVEDMEPGDANGLNLGGIYMLLLLVAEEAPGQRDLETPAVRDGIRDLLTNRRGSLLQAAYVSAARAEATVTNFLAQQVLEANGDLQLPLSRVPVLPAAATPAANAPADPPPAAE